MSFNIKTATRNQMIAYALDNDIALAGDLKPAGMRAALKKAIAEREAAEAKVEAEVVEAEAPAVVEEAVPSEPYNPWQDKVTIHIHKTPGATGASDVFVGVNEKSFLIQRGVDVEVPRPVVEVLKNANERVTVQNPKTGELESRETQSYPFMVVS